MVRKKFLAAALVWVGCSSPVVEPEATGSVEQAMTGYACNSYWAPSAEQCDPCGSSDCVSLMMECMFSADTSCSQERTYDSSNGACRCIFERTYRQPPPDYGCDEWDCKGDCWRDGYD